MQRLISFKNKNNIFSIIGLFINQIYSKLNRQKKLPLTGFGYIPPKVVVKKKKDFFMGLHVMENVDA